MPAKQIRVREHTLRQREVATPVRWGRFDAVADPFDIAHEPRHPRTGHPRPPREGQVVQGDQAVGVPVVVRVAREHDVGLVLPLLAPGSAAGGLDVAEGDVVEVHRGWGRVLGGEVELVESDFRAHIVHAQVLVSYVPHVAGTPGVTFDARASGRAHECNVPKCDLCTQSRVSLDLMRAPATKASDRASGHHVAQPVVAQGADGGAVARPEVGVLHQRIVRVRSDVVVAFELSRRSSTLVGTNAL